MLYYHFWNNSLTYVICFSPLFPALRISSRAIFRDGVGVRLWSVKSIANLLSRAMGDLGLLRSGKDVPWPWLCATGLPGPLYKVTSLRPKTGYLVFINAIIVQLPERNAERWKNLSSVYIYFTSSCLHFDSFKICFLYYYLFSIDPLKLHYPLLIYLLILTKHVEI